MADYDGLQTEINIVATLRETAEEIVALADQLRRGTEDAHSITYEKGWKAGNADAQERITALEAELAQERQLHAATRHREELLQRGGARLVEQAALADELAGMLRALHGGNGKRPHAPTCPFCALLARHAALKEASRD